MPGLVLLCFLLMFPLIALAQAATPEAGLLEALGKGDYVLALGFGTMLLTRLLTVGPLKEKIPGRYLPWVAVVLGMLSQASVAITSGVPWQRALLLGLAAGLVAIGSWETIGKHSPVLKKAGGSPTGPAGPAGPVVLLLMIFTFGASGCASSFVGKVSQMSTGVASLRQVSREAFKWKCGAIADVCKSEKETKKYAALDDCPEWKSCDTLRVEIFWGASTTQMLLDTSLVVYSGGKPKDAEAIFKQASTAFDNLREKIAKHKLLEVLK